MNRENGGADRPWPDVVPIEEFLTRPTGDQVRYLIDGLLPASGTALLTGPPKSGKSVLSRTIANAVLDGQTLFGRNVVAGPVILLGLEDDPSQLQAELCRTRRLTDGEKFFIYAGAAPNDGVAWVEYLIQRHEPRLLIIDTVNRLLRIPDLNEYGDVGNRLEPLTDLARTNGTHIFCLHHKTKGKSGVDSVSGSTALAGSFDTLLFLNRGAGGIRTLCSEQRYGTKLSQIRLALNPETGLVAAAEHAMDRDVRIAEAAILRAISEGAETEGQIRKVVGGDHGRIATVLRDLYNDGRVERATKRGGSARKGDPYLYTLNLVVTPPTRINEKGEQLESVTGGQP